MNTGVLNLSSAPHGRDRWTTPFIMRVVFLSLMPATIVGVIVYGWHSAAVIALSVVTAVLAEFLFNKACHKPSSIWDGSAVVTGLLLGSLIGGQCTICHSTVVKLDIEVTGFDDVVGALHCVCEPCEGCTHEHCEAEQKREHARKQCFFRCF